MSNSRSTKTISAETSAVVASADLLHWQGIFATFLKDASAALSRPHFYSSRQMAGKAFAYWLAFRHQYTANYSSNASLFLSEQ